MFVRTLLILLTVISTSVFAEDEVVQCPAQRAPYVVKSTTADDLASMDVSGGTVYIDEYGRNVILYDETLESTPEAKNHVIAHECAHHLLGHVHMPVIPNYWANEAMKERPADCVASKLLVQQLGYGQGEFDEIASFIRQYQPPVEAEARVAHIKACAGMR